MFFNRILLFSIISYTGSEEYFPHLQRLAKEVSQSKIETFYRVFGRMVTELLSQGVTKFIEKSR